MSETTALTKAPLRGGGGVMAIIPQDVDQVWRMAGMAVAGGMAPQSLVTGKRPEEAQAACAIAIMAGAELGLTPLMALRSYAVVNGRPSLWGDGIKAVVRQSGRCEYIKSGGDLEKGWCEAKRSDTGEVQRKEFTFEQAKRAGLSTKKGPWQDYPDMMMERRAVARCLNDLFADVLGGIVSAEEAQDSVTYEVIEDRPRTPPPPPPAPEEAEEEGESQSGADMPDDAASADSGPSSFDFDRLDADMVAASDEETLEEVWDAYDLPSALTHDEEALARAFEIKKAHQHRIENTFTGDR